MGGCIGSNPKKRNDKEPTQEISNTKHEAELKKYRDIILAQAQQIDQLLSYQSVSSLAVSTQVAIKLTLFTQQIKNFKVQRTSTVGELKRYIFETQCQQLRPQMMIIMREGKIMNVNQAICGEGMDANKLQLSQRIAQVWQLGLNSDRERIDQISQERGVVILSCNHVISRGGFIAALNYQLDVVKQQEIRCPFLSADGNICNRLIEAKYYQLFAGYTQGRWRQISDRLSENFVINNTTMCPGRHPILKNGLTEKRITCPVCRCKFCFQCSQKWVGNGNDCMSQRCFAVGNLIANAPWDRVFQMYEMPKNNIKFAVKVPNLRACPTCKTLIKNTANCKHTECICGVRFCFVCLKTGGSEWPCGQPYEYCGFVAPNQNMKINLQAVASR